MFASSIPSAPPPVTPPLRKPVARPVVQDTPPQPEVKTGVESLSLETRVDLSQKAQVQPPPPPQHSKKKNTAPEARNPKAVEGEDFAGRLCSGTLHGPLLMEEPSGLAIECKNPQDFQAMYDLGMQLGQVPPELLHAPAGDTPVMKEPGFTYHGIGPEGARLVQHLENGVDAPAEESKVTLPGGQIVLVTRGPNEISILVPPASLDELANWGRTLLAVA